MSDTALNFDSTGVPPQTALEVIPGKKYPMQATDAEIKPTSAGDGKYLQIVWEVLEGEYKGRKVWDRLNIVNPNATTTEIAQRQLSAICHATGVLKITDAKQLLMRPILGNVGIKKGSNGYPPQNVMRGYEPIANAAAGATAPGATPAAPAAPPTTATNVPPWAAKRAS